MTFFSVKLKIIFPTFFFIIKKSFVAQIVFPLTALCYSSSHLPIAANKLKGLHRFQKYCLLLPYNSFVRLMLKQLCSFFFLWLMKSSDVYPPTFHVKSLPNSHNFAGYSCTVEGCSFVGKNWTEMTNHKKVHIGNPVFSSECK